MDRTRPVIASACAAFLVLPFCVLASGSHARYRRQSRLLWHDGEHGPF